MSVLKCICDCVVLSAKKYWSIVNSPVWWLKSCGSFSAIEADKLATDRATLDHDQLSPKVGEAAAAKAQADEKLDQGNNHRRDCHEPVRSRPTPAGWPKSGKALLDGLDASPPALRHLPPSAPMKTCFSSVLQLSAVLEADGARRGGRPAQL